MSLVKVTEFEERFYGLFDLIKKGQVTKYSPEVQQFVADVKTWIESSPLHVSIDPHAAEMGKRAMDTAGAIIQNIFGMLDQTVGFEQYRQQAAVLFQELNKELTETKGALTETKGELKTVKEELQLLKDAKNKEEYHVVMNEMADAYRQDVWKFRTKPNDWSSLCTAVANAAAQSNPQIPSRNKHLEANRTILVPIIENHLQTIHGPRHAIPLNWKQEAQLAFTMLRFASGRAAHMDEAEILTKAPHLQPPNPVENTAHATLWGHFSLTYP